jgi:hypothetical protein
MNLVKLINDQLSAESLGQLSSLLGVDSETTEAAAGAAVPSLLAGIAGLATQEDGIRKLSTTLNGLGEGVFGNFQRTLGGDTNAVRETGTRLLGGLFGPDLIGNLASAISRYTGLEAGTAKTLLSYLAPLVLGRVASQWQNQGGTPGALKNLFADQKRYIEDALPTGYSLTDVPGLARMGDADRATTAAASQAKSEAKSLAGTLLPLGLLLVGAALLWGFWQNRQAPQRAAAEPELEEPRPVVAMKPVIDAADVPTAEQVRSELTKGFAELDATLANVKDAASAQAALPKLKSWSEQVDGWRQAWLRIPAAGRTSLMAFVTEQINSLKQKAAGVLSLPGLPSEIKTTIAGIVQKLDELARSGTAQ